jgi:ZIP family zinc transporter
VSENLAVIILAILSGLTTLIGVSLVFIFKRRLKELIVGMGFSAGIMLLISFFELIPESVSAAGLPSTLLATCLGTALIFALNFIIPHTHLIKEKGKFDSQLLKSVYLVVFGLILHDFPEGFAMANSYLFSPHLGIIVAISIALHNIPEEFAIAAPIITTTKKKGPLIKAALISSMAEPAGAILGLLAVNLFSFLNPLFMSFAAGAMIFISLHELLPLAKRYKRPELFGLGIILAIFIYLGLNLVIPE